MRHKSEKPRGILRLGAPWPIPGYRRYWPSPELATYIEHHWVVEWDLREAETRETLPHPSVQLLLETGRSAIGGVLRSRFTRVLEGKGRVRGTKFRPGGFRPFAGGPVSALTDRRLALHEFFGEPGQRLEERVVPLADDEEAIGFVEAFLLRRSPQPDATVDLVARISERIATDRNITKVGQIADAFGLSARKLQRLFTEYVGIGPKWMVQRYRLIEAAERIAADPTEDWVHLALDLGYADQAHFIRDFKRLVGCPPGEYANGLGGSLIKD